MMGNHYSYDVLVIGSGAAGLSVALQLPDSCSVAVLSKGQLLKQGSTFYAQGGIAAVIDEKDSILSHVQDTINAGAGLCHRTVVESIVSQSTASIKWLVDQGVSFTSTSEGKLHLTREGGHSHRRIIHSADATGRAIAETLSKNALSHSNISFFTDRVAIDLITGNKLDLPETGCIGAYILNIQTGRVELFQAKHVVLATGGASKAYLYTSNPDGASGDGIAMAWRAGCRVANMEFNQFHPTCLYHPQAKSFLITEALRGEGAKLRLPNGNLFMEKFDPQGEMAPRDIVARAIDHEMKRLGLDCVYLDITHKKPEFIKNHFPTIYQGCIKYGIDITHEYIPVVPAAHYTCGGVVVDDNGCTDVKNLYAIGETCFSGLHGANRMASNSLLECIVLAHRAAQHIKAHLHNHTIKAQIPPWDESQVTNSDEDVVISHNWDEVRRFMWDYVGIVRTNKRLQRAKHRIDLLQQEITEYYSNYRVSNDLIELRNLALVADLMIQSAMLRKESRGLHYTLDYPQKAKIAQDTILYPLNFQA